MYPSHSANSSHRFAWLTPVQKQESSTGPWVLCENRTQHLEKGDLPCVRVTVNALLNLLATSIHPKGLDGQNELTGEHRITSGCGRFEARQIKQNNDTSRLFVQQSTDFFKRLELYIDDELITAFHEPVWPHLQQPQHATGSRLTLPLACVDMLEKAAQSLSDQYGSLDATQQLPSNDSEAAAA